MRLSFLNKPSKTSFLIYPVFAKETIFDARFKHLLRELHTSKEFEAKEGQICFLLREKTLFLGMGNIKKINVSSLMETFGSGVKVLQGYHPAKVAVVVPETLHSFLQSITEAIALANYQADAPYKTGKARSKLQTQRIKELEIIVKRKRSDIENIAKKGLEISNVVNDVRDWVNAPPNIANGEFFEKKANEIAKSIGAKLTILRKKELEKLGMGALLGVNRGSPDEARLVVIDWQPKEIPMKEKPIVFVGKGILFDSGGYNLKPSGHIENMQLDKAGAASILGLMKLLPRLGIKHRVITVAPFTENLIGPTAQKPSDIVKTYSGKTIEVTNTDAEGRLILADAVAYAVDQFKPELLIDVATLTGACIVALGHRYAGLFGNDENLQKLLREAGDRVDELLWPLPIHKDYAEKMKGHYADLCNSSTDGDRGAGASKGAAFIREFVGKTKWAHLDIAGPAFVGEPKKYESKGATGFGVRLLARFLENLK